MFQGCHEGTSEIFQEQQVFKNVSEKFSNTFLTSFQKMFQRSISKRFSKVFKHISGSKVWVFHVFVTSLIWDCFKNVSWMFHGCLRVLHGYFMVVLRVF